MSAVVRDNMTMVVAAAGEGCLCYDDVCNLY